MLNEVEDLFEGEEELRFFFLQQLAACASHMITTMQKHVLASIYHVI